MKVEVAKTAGFCFGVQRAVNAVDLLLNSGKKVYTLGEVIHNPRVTQDFKNRGSMVVSHPREVTDKESVIVVRSHGAPKEIFEYMKKNKIEFIDATCPFVKNIHKIVEKNTKKGQFLLLAGDENHPEVRGILSYSRAKNIVFRSLEDIQKIFSLGFSGGAVIAAQTTFSYDEWTRCLDFFEKCFTNSLIFDTICNTTNLRQKEAKELAKSHDVVVVIGGKNSSNTGNLAKICRNFTKTFLIQNVKELNAEMFKNLDKVAVTAGASTPSYAIEEVLEFLKTLK